MSDIFRTAVWSEYRNWRASWMPTPSGSRFRSTCDIEALKKLLVGNFGPDVNVANVSPDTVIDFEATRTGLGVAGPLGYRAALS